ncbi:gluconokinase [Sphingobacterium chuzhouense]|uniref:Gluconokinase n=1 Tax=Sphingobacterium chuzhouense TaxID=1742264 RepID=A0ABR7XUE8_9SPHI|nr:gluconokinase [Sphingobacterium chuzhouense]MBD1422668.1 gluconokinase [Sphingobacterium chuzhouense]
MIIGLDIGTSSTKAIAFDQIGTIITQFSVPYPILSPQSGFYEQDPLQIYEACIRAVSEVMDALKNSSQEYRLEGIALSSAMHGVIAMDDMGTPLTNCIIWADTRSQDIADNLRGTSAGHQLFRETGTPIHPMSPLCKLIWINKHMPNIFHKTHKFIGIKEYIFFQLFRTYVVDYSIASATGLLDIHRMHWSELALSKAGITDKQLSSLVSVDYVLTVDNEATACLWGIPIGTPFVIGASDGCLANLGVGATTPGIASVTVGTSGAIRVVTDRSNTDSKERVFSYILRPGEFVVGGAINNAGVVRKWFMEQFMSEFPQLSLGMDAAALFDNEVRSVAPGSDGLIFLPYVTGERAPYWDAKAKGVYFGIQLQHSRAHFARAMIEGMLFALLSVGIALEETTQPIEIIYASGGLARSVLWVQMLADVFNKPVYVKENVESSAWGAAIIGMEALGISRAYLSTHTLDAHSTQYLPDEHNHRIYMENFRKFERLYFKLKEEF